MAKTANDTKKHAKKPTVKQVREQKLQVSDTEIGKFKAGSGPITPSPTCPSPMAM